jgi:hypothetical protein
MHEVIMKKLYEKFNLSTRQGQGGMTFKYVPNEDVINRMNEVFAGDWSTSVKFKDVIDDQVILEVEVKVVDPGTEITHSHTGFGSQQIMRYNSGTNAGKIIDIGNGYKGALAKAIVNACTRWGVGLYKESNPTAAPAVGTPAAVAIPANIPTPTLPPVPNTAVAPPVMPPITTVVPPVAQPITTATPPPVPMPPTTASPTPSPYTIETTAPPVAEVPSIPTPPMVEPVVVETITTFPPPMSPDQPVAANINLTQELPKLPTPATATVPITPTLPLSVDEGLSGIGISDVQRVALNGILTMNNAQYNELALEAFQANGINKVVPNKEDLNYDEAVVVIKFGNDKYRKNR